MTLKSKVARNAIGMNARFNRGDKVVSRSGKNGVVHENIDDNWYAVHFEGENFPTKIEASKIKAANAVPAGATALRIAYDVDGRPIKVGDKVTATAGASFKEDVVASIFKDGVKGIFVTLKSSPLVRRDPSAEIMKNSCALKSKVARNAVAACNDKWIDDFHVIVTAEKPDPALVDALKKKAAAWKAYKRNFSDKAADEAHEKAKSELAAIANRLGAKLEQRGAVLRVIMPNTATNAKDANGVEIKIGSLVRPKSMRPGMEEVVKRIDGNKVWYKSTYDDVWEYANNLIVVNAVASKSKIKVAQNADLVSLEDLLKKYGISRDEYVAMSKEMAKKGASAVHFVRGKDGKLRFKADGTTIGNATCKNANIDPMVKAAYDKYLKAKAKFEKWWNPERSMADGVKSKFASEYSDAQSEFAKAFRNVFKRPTPNGWGDMTLEQMVQKISNSRACNSTNPIVRRVMNSVRNSVFQTENELERAIGAKLGKSVDVGIDGKAVSIGLESKGDIEKTVAVVKEKLGDVVSYKYMDGSDPWLLVMLKTSVPNAATNNATDNLVYRKAVEALKSIKAPFYYIGDGSGNGIRFIVSSYRRDDDFKKKAKEIATRFGRVKMDWHREIGEGDLLIFITDPNLKWREYDVKFDNPRNAKPKA